MFGGIGGLEILLVLVVGIVLFGVIKMPQIARLLGSGFGGYNKLKRGMNFNNIIDRMAGDGEKEGGRQRQEGPDQGWQNPPSGQWGPDQGWQNPPSGQWGPNQGWQNPPSGQGGRTGQYRSHDPNQFQRRGQGGPMDRSEGPRSRPPGGYPPHQSDGDQSTRDPGPHPPGSGDDTG
jgi:Sec-independent protein translocase protein TatA